MVTNNPIVSITKVSKDYELLDSGGGEKLERYGKVVMSRPDPQALWPKKLSEESWKNIDAKFVKEGQKFGWYAPKSVPEKWQIEFGGLNFWIKPTAFKHTGLFPEQEENWNWMKGVIKKVNKPISVLNLFGYTGGASLAASSVGASVCHVDASKAAVNWASENAELSGLKGKPTRWIVDDAHAFVKRELKRGNRFDAIVMDPPSFGRGPRGQIWKLEENFLPLLDDCRKILSNDPIFVLINGYAAGYSSFSYLNCLNYMMEGKRGNIEFGELVIEESGKNPRALPAGIFARWSK